MAKEFGMKENYLINIEGTIEQDGEADTISMMYAAILRAETAIFSSAIKKQRTTVLKEILPPLR